MVTRAQLERLACRMERLVGDGGISIPVYGEESEAEGKRKPTPTRL